MTVSASRWSMRIGHFHALTIGAALAMRLAPDPAASLSYVLVALYALSGRAQAIQGLALSWLFTFLSPGIAAEAAASSVGRYAVLAAAAGSVFLRNYFPGSRRRVSWPVVATVLLGAFLVMHSLLFSPIVDVSVLKAVSWVLATVTLLDAWSSLSAQERDRLMRQLTGGLMLLIIVSLPLLVSPLGYLRNQKGFQGVMSHPQAFGPTMALLGAWAFARLIAIPKPAWTLGLVAVGCLAMVLLSESRTAGLAMILGLATAMAISAVSGRPNSSALPGLRSRRVQLMFGTLVVGALLAGPSLGSLIGAYFEKRGSAGGIAGAYEASRGFLILRMWRNIREQPLQGIGFGIASVPEKMVVDRDPILGLPAGAAVEKGVMPLAVLEELGALGFVVVSLWFLMVFRRAARGGVVPLALSVTILLLNLAESMFFSPGGMGLLLLILLSWAATSRRPVGLPP